MSMKENPDRKKKQIAEAKYSINFTESGKRFVLSLHYNVSNSFLFVNKVKMYQFKGKKLRKSYVYV